MTLQKLAHLHTYVICVHNMKLGCSDQQTSTLSTTSFASLLLILSNRRICFLLSTFIN